MHKVTLTFDNGPSSVTGSVLDCLAAHRVKASFFVVGQNLSQQENLNVAMRASREGHWLGNHTFTHTKPLGELDATAALWEFQETERALSWLNQPVKLFRPYGRGGGLGPNLLHPVVVDKLVAGEYSCVLWNSVPRDWEDHDGWVEHALADCRRLSWSLVVLHDLPTGAMSHLGEFIGSLKSEGFEITQEYPDSCVPILKGKQIAPLDEYLQILSDGSG